MRKNSTLVKILSVLVFFEVSKTSLLQFAFKFDIKLHLKPFFFKKAFLHF